MPTREVEVADTLPPEDTMGPAPAPASAQAQLQLQALASSPGGPPVGNWDRYELLDLLGRGGMGLVYKARDRRLGRTIAIKFILGADPNLTMRFLREARAQARIEHPNVCRVYEVGEVQGRAYIALQFVDGEPLHKAAARMSLDEKIAVVRDIAVAVHEAHRLGIVHRDLKPGNVLVERTDDGRWFPIVMDFGLAREATVEAGITESGMPLGTPAYMSPEQARGDIHAIDRRSDVYSLGATLYELLTGTVPFPATSLALALAKVLHEDPPAPRGLVPSLPVDLETIALKCLAKDPAQRYPSARALADDLGRYLDGEPILGRRLSLWQRVRLRARRHRALVILGAWSLAIIVVVATLWIRAWLISRAERELAAKRTRLAERLGREATEIEGYLRDAYLWPLHDTRFDRKRIRERMDAIGATRHELGELGDAIVYNALGRGHLAFHEWREANDDLSRATAAAAAAGLQVSELHAARGRALGELYRRALEEVRLPDDKTDTKAWLAQREQELAQQYLTPALDELGKARASGEEAELLEARIALYRRDFATAEQKARKVADSEVGSSEARKLAGDAAYRAAIGDFDHGDYDAARTGLDRAARLYVDASNISRSDASAYQAAAEAWLQIAEIDFRQGRQARKPLTRAIDLIENGALLADPDDALSHMTLAYVLLRWYRTPALVDQDDERPPLLDRIAHAAERAVEIDRQDAHAWTSLGNAHVYRCIYETDHGRQGAPWCNRALDAFNQALKLQPRDPRANNGLGTAHRWLGNSLNRTGHDPMPEYQLALRSYEHATEIVPQDLPACTNQVELHASFAEHDNAIGDDPRPAVDDAQRVGERCLAINRNEFYVLEHLARAQLALARYLVQNGNPTEALARARDYVVRDETVHPGYMSARYYRAVAAAAEAAFRLRQEVDPMSSVAAGRAALKEALRLMPDSALCYVEAARLDLVEAAWAAHAGREAGSVLATARADAEKAVALDKQLADAHLVAAEACLQLATAHRSPEIINDGLTHTKQALDLNQRLAEAKRVRDALDRLQAP